MKIIDSFINYVSDLVKSEHWRWFSLNLTCSFYMKILTKKGWNMFSVTKETQQSQMSFRQSVIKQNPQQLEIIILHTSSFIIILHFTTFKLFSLLSGHVTKCANVTNKPKTIIIWKPILAWQWIKKTQF